MEMRRESGAAFLEFDQKIDTIILSINFVLEKNTLSTTKIFSSFA